MNDFINVVSSISIEYKDGFFHVVEMSTPVSKHKTLSEAQWIKSVLESDSIAA